MKRNFWTCLVMLLVGSSWAAAQPAPMPTGPGGPASPPQMAAPGVATLVPSSAATVTTEIAQCVDFNGFGSSGIRFKANAEYLLWWITNGPVPFPLVTTGSVANPAAGVLGQPDTQILFGGKAMDYGAFSGGRLTLGGWMDEGDTAGVEVRAFTLQERRVSFGVSSNAAGVPVITFPFFDVTSGAENGIVVANPITIPFAGGVAISSGSQLFGGEVNAVCLGFTREQMRLDFFAGLRFLDLQEDITISDAAKDLTLGVLNQLDESFRTKNRFYGANFGATMTWQSDLLVASVRAQLAVGDAEEDVVVNGAISQSGAAAPHPGVSPGGVFAQTSNLGNHDTQRGAVIPELQGTIGVRITSNLLATVGYNVLYWGEVIRPGNQIDHNVNTTQSIIFGGGALVGTSAPVVHLIKSELWADGLTFGMEYHY